MRKHVRKHVVVRNVGAVDGVTIATGAGVHADVLSVFHGKAVHHRVDELHKVGKHAAGRSHALRLSLRQASRPSVKSIDTRAAPRRECTANVPSRTRRSGPLQIGRENSPVSPRPGHRAGPSMEGEITACFMGRDAICSAFEVASDAKVLYRKGAARQLRQLAVMAVCEDCEELSARRQMVRQPRAGERVREGVGGKNSTTVARRPRTMGEPVASIRVMESRTALSCSASSWSPLDLACVVGGIRLLQRHGSGQGTHRFPSGCPFAVLGSYGHFILLLVPLAYLDQWIVCIVQWDSKQKPSQLGNCN